ncbi:ABC transporter substrate-binding protein [Anaerolentibacter hominis]|uniref:ABC transporter substrate-binding protein n=1 Tax=Anaerolentibacter hominis TaxID=3079009 RepID=UPI0031B8B2DF
MKKWLLCLVFLVLLMNCLTGCSKNAASAQNEGKEQTEKIGETLRVALVGPMTGDFSQYGTSFKKGVQLFIDLYNENGGYHGTPVEIEIFDDKNDAKEAATIANKILAEGDYACVIGPFSSTCALAMAEVLDQEKVLTIAPSCSHPDYTALYDYTFRMPLVNTEEARAAAEYLDDKLNAKKVGVIYTNNDWGATVDGAFTEYAAEHNLEIVADEGFIIGQTKDFTPMITKMKQGGAEAVYLICQYTEGAQMIRQIEDNAPDIRVVLSGSAYQEEILTLAGDGAKDAAWIVSASAQITDKMKELDSILREKYDGSSDDNFVCYAYNAAMVALTGLEKAGTTDADAWKQAILDIGDYEGLNGKFKIRTEDRNIDGVYAVAKVNEDGASFTKYAFADIK